MIKKRSIVNGLILGTLLSGCGGLDDDNRNDDGFLNHFDPAAVTGPPIDDSNRDLTVAEVAGVWELTHEIYFDDALEKGAWAESEEVIVITEDGDYFEYDYKGDSLATKEDDYGNCYTVRRSGRIDKEADGGFRLSFESPPLTLFAYTNYDKHDGQLIAAISPHINDAPVVQLPPSAYTQAELDSMLCMQED